MGRFLCMSEGQLRGTFLGHFFFDEVELMDCFF